MKFSVIIPAYNAGKCIKRSIDSVLKQCYIDFEVIIVDDGSSDNTVENALSFSDKRIMVIKNQHGGVSKARNDGICNSSGDYICFLDADDEWLDNHLDELNKAIQIYSNRKFFATGSVMELKDGKLAYEGKNLSSFPENYYSNFFEVQNQIGFYFNTNCVCVQRDVFNKYGYFANGIGLSEDRDMWYRIVIFEGIVVIPQYTTLRHRDYSQATKKRRYDAEQIFWETSVKRIHINELDNDMQLCIKKGLQSYMLSKARGKILVGNKIEAIKILRQANRDLVSRKRYIITILSLLVPSIFLRTFVDFRDRKFFY